MRETYILVLSLGSSPTSLGARFIKGGGDESRMLRTPTSLGVSHPTDSMGVVSVVI